MAGVCAGPLVYQKRVTVSQPQPTPRLQLSAPGQRTMPLYDHSLQDRRHWHTIVFCVLGFWMLWGALIQVLRWQGQDLSWWLAIHSITIGVIATAIMVYSTHFAQALTRSAHTGYRGVASRVLLINIGFVMLVLAQTGNTFGMWSYLGAGLIATAFLWQLILLVHLLRVSLSGRFAVTVLSYIFAAICLLVAIAAALLAVSYPERYTAWISIHARWMLWGFVLSTIVGTVVTLLPTIAGVQISQTAVSRVQRRLVLQGLGLLCYGLGQLAQLVSAASVGLLLIALALGSVLAPVVREVHSPQLRGATALMASALGWIVVCLLADATYHVAGWNPRASLLQYLPVLLGAGVVPLILAVLSFLLPTLRGGGPDQVLRARRLAQQGWTYRVALTAIGGLGCLVRTNMPAQWTTWWPVVSYLPLLLAAIWGLVALVRSVLARGRGLAARSNLVA